ncbi:ABC transporter ATP-binding protein [Corynebacterium accolens]|uniref:ABC transporter ATP-binding protein n=1 Tax=Corynebacterium accolens TaxID=38284 RepID=UPI002551215E|nr:ABC transporter ATP-binding protein [Corynebacterium accolens]MDK8469076.1 ABC transporter ATP-binding protein [Corynebacterium accolens]MDK8499220.1 ABC transporter ATP-binding protein [Corynebacterium accolens]MDK8675993.1 ABC transporter ATP-binding protein [Corynebacterium accolens]
MRFPTATWPQVRKVVAQQLSAIPHARRRALIAVAFLIAGAAANVTIPILLGKIVDTVTTGASIALLGVLLIGVAAASAALSAAGFYVLSQLTERVIASLREDMVSTALGLPTHRVEDAGTGDLVSRSTDDVAELSAAVTETVPVLAKSIFAIASTAVALLTVDWQYLVVILAVTPLYFLAGRYYLRRAPDRYTAERAAMADRARRLLEAIHGRDTVRAFRMENTMHDRIGAASTRVVEEGYNARRTMMVLQAHLTGIELVLLGSGLAVSFWVVQANALTVGAVTAAMLLLIRLRGPLMGLMRVLDTVQSGYASLARIVGVVIDPPEPVPDSGAPRGDGSVDMRDISFRYDDNSWAVEGLNLAITPGETVALVGASGAGKSTVAALLAGLRVPDQGTVLVDGVEVALLSDAERIQRLALVSQEVHVFSGSLREDLALAAPQATNAEMVQALRQVQADWFFDLEAGLDTIVGAQGMPLDPVAAQQLALARIVLLDPRIIILDEATAEAGSVGAESLEDAAETVMEGRTALVVAHRLDQASRADAIVVMDNGRVVEQGSHAELLNYGGRYKQLWAAWQKGRTS